MSGMWNWFWNISNRKNEWMNSFIFSNYFILVTASVDSREHLVWCGNTLWIIHQSIIPHHTHTHIHTSRQYLQQTIHLPVCFLDNVDTTWAQVVTEFTHPKQTNIHPYNLKVLYVRTSHLSNSYFTLQTNRGQYITRKLVCLPLS